MRFGHLSVSELYSAFKVDSAPLPENWPVLSSLEKTGTLGVR